VLFGSRATHPLSVCSVWILGAVLFTLGSYEPYRVGHDLTLEEGHGGCLRSVRPAAKDAEPSIVARIGENFNLTPVLGHAHYEQMARYFAEYGPMALRPA
jgi:hypothetical protein